MSERAAATFKLKSWDEKPYNEMQGVPKLTRVSATKLYQGGIVGEGGLEYLMMYREDGSAIFTGLERVVGNVGGRSGSFVFQHSGTFERGVAKVTLSVVAGSGTEGLHRRFTQPSAPATARPMTLWSKVLLDNGANPFGLVR